MVLFIQIKFLYEFFKSIFRSGEFFHIASCDSDMLVIMVELNIGINCWERKKMNFSTILMFLSRPIIILL